MTKPLILLLAAALSLFPVAARADDPKPAKPAAPAKDKPNPAASGLDVSVKSARVDAVALKRPLQGGGFEDLISNQKVLIVTLTVANKGQKEITYKSFNGTPTGDGADRARLLTTNRKLLPLVNFGDMEVPDAVKKATLKPGESVTDVLCFMAPPAGIVPQTLILPARNHGDAGTWELPVKLEAEEK